ncbi:putative RNA pseudouridylate synthase [Trypanosoma theileri]|uniref:Putative RNA pseudouridylate synthase n=1 Tax=Trypanosoma theileri TaxID=67003 RepID=A0A1X0NMU5_9TRYP|nr:putative RNA pseudouridylate synthase [Trypanosoma theileri]ORC85459.1 putative RNA pseudouridylate synthase [Trypanosoma theileri]
MLMLVCTSCYFHFDSSRIYAESVVEEMMQGKSVAMTAGLSSRVAVPRSYVRAALRGLRDAVGRPCAPYTSREHLKGLDRALRYAVTFQERSEKRWTEVNRALEPNKNIIRVSEDKILPLGFARTLQQLDGDDENNDESYPDKPSAAQWERQQVSPTFSEKQQARLHAALQQWVFYCSFHISQKEFLARQSKISAVLLLSPIRVVPSSSSRPESANSLGISVRRRGAQAYVDLLVHHRLMLNNEEEWITLCKLYSGSEEKGEGNELSVMKLPFISSSENCVSCERSLAVLSWAMQFQQQQQQRQVHISSSDIANVLQQYAQQFGERIEVPEVRLESDNEDGTLKLSTADEQAVVTRLQQWWATARDAEKQNSKLAEACGLDRTAPSWIHVEGRKVTLSPSSDTPVVGDTVFAELLLQGRWEDVLRHIESVATVALQLNEPTIDMEEEKRITKEELEEVACVVDEKNEERQYSLGSVAPSLSSSKDNVISQFFNRRRPLLVKRKLWVHSTASRLGRVPRKLLLTPETPSEVSLLQKPPMIGLRSRREHLSVVNEKQQNLDGLPRSPPSLALMELRRKLWILAQLPRRIPRSLVRFEGTGASMLPYLQRSLAKELVPWVILSTIVAIAREELKEDIHEGLKRVRAQVLYTLFSPISFYAAFQEYCSDLIVQFGSLLAPPSVIRVAVRSILRPPSLRHFYDVLGTRRNQIESVCRQMWWGSLDTAMDSDEQEELSSSTFSQTTISSLERIRSDSDALRKFFESKAGSMRNYHISMWIESCSKVETLAELLDILVREVNCYGPPLLSPEAAASLLTAVVLPLIASNGRNIMDSERNILRALGVVYFVVPADRVFGAAPYFKGTYHERYIHSTPLEWTTSWDGSEALLVGRSLRHATKYPTTTTESFLRVDKRHGIPTLTFRVPELKVRLMTVDLLEAVSYFDEGKKQEQLQKRGDMVNAINGETVEADKNPFLVASHLPLGVVAVSKPSGMSTTLHAGFPHLVNFLAQHVPWRGDGTPVLYQHGLVNRIDVGTSGLVLATDTEASLVAARRASVVDHVVEKTYRALLLRCPPPASRVDGEECWYLNPHGVITRDVFANGADFSLQRAATHNTQRDGLPTASADWRRATTAYRVLRYFPASGVYDVEVRLRAGRRHQIRQHFALLWHPLLGDGRYHERAKSMGERVGLHRPALHAFTITMWPARAGGSASVAEYADCEKTVVECPLPGDMRHALEMLQKLEGKD